MILGMNPQMRKSLGPTNLGLGYKRTPRERQDSHPPNPNPHPHHEEDHFSPSSTLEDQIPDLTMRFDAYYDKTQEHQVLISQDMDMLKAEMNIVLRNQAVILSNQESIQQQLTHLLMFHTPPP